MHLVAHESERSGHQDLQEVVVVVVVGIDVVVVWVVAGVVLSKCHRELDYGAIEGTYKFVEVFTLPVTRLGKGPIIFTVKRT